VIDHPLDLAPALQPGQREVGGQAQLRQAEGGPVGILRDEERVVRLAQEAGVLARRNRAVTKQVREAHEGRHARPGRGQPIHHGAVGGEQLLAVTEADVVQRRGVAGQAIVGGRVVVLHLVVQGPHQGELVGHRGKARQALAHLQAGHTGRYGAELAPHRVRRGRLHVERVVMARPPELMQEDNRAGPGFGPATTFRRPEEGRQPEQAEAADLDQMPARPQPPAEVATARG
jgi:hypothetical protein